MPINSRAIEVLLVEDHPGDANLTRIALADRQEINLQTVVADGVEAMNFLHRQGEDRQAIPPDRRFLV
jgi:CheY-like chemotaxis protein